MAVVYQFVRKSSQAGYTMARRGLCYAGSVVILQLPYLVAAAVRIVYDSELLQGLCASTIALAGLLNMLVFCMYRRKMRTAYGRLVRKIIDAVACCKPMETKPELVPVGRDLFLTTDASIKTRSRVESQDSVDGKEELKMIQ